MDDWVISLIDRLEQAINLKRPIELVFDGKKVFIEIKREVVDLIRNNRESLLKMGKKVFREVLILMSEGKDFEAKVKVYEQFDNDELLDKYRGDSIKLVEIAARVQAGKDFWFSLCKKVGTKIVFAALGKLL